MSSSIEHTTPGSLSLYELNINREELIFPFSIKESSLSSLKSISKDEFDTEFKYGDIISGSYPLSASLGIEFITGSTRPKITALKNTLNHYKLSSQHYEYSSSLGDKGNQELLKLNIPSIFYGSRIKKGSVELDFYVTGTLVGKLKDSRGNGELIQSNGELSSSDGLVAGVVLYREGLIILTGSWSFSNHTEDYRNNGGSTNPAWKYFGASGSISNRLPSSSYNFNFEGVNYIPTITMFAHAPKGTLNNSSNPTFVRNDESYKLNSFVSSSQLYEEREDILIANTTKLPYSSSNGDFKKQTYISKIGIYDDKRNLIAVAKLAKPIKKTEERELTFKMTLDV